MAFVLSEILVLPELGAGNACYPPFQEFSTTGVRGWEAGQKRLINHKKKDMLLCGKKNAFSVFLVFFFFIPG